MLCIINLINYIDLSGGAAGIGILGGTFCGAGGECYCNGGYIGNGRLNGTSTSSVSNNNVPNGGCCNVDADCSSGNCDTSNNVFTNGTNAGTQNYVCVA